MYLKDIIREVEMMVWLDLFILFFCCVVEVFLLYDYFYNFLKLK